MKFRITWGHFSVPPSKASWHEEPINVKKSFSSPFSQLEVIKQPQLSCHWSYSKSVNTILFGTRFRFSRVGEKWPTTGRTTLLYSGENEGHCFITSSQLSTLS